jgi:Holliday junction resolvasome RuvABC endonuclease subunit
VIDAKQADPIIIVGVDPGKTTGIVVIEVNIKANRWKLLDRAAYGPTTDGATLAALLVRLRVKMRDQNTVVAKCAMEQLMAYTNSAQEKAEAQAIVRLAAHYENVTMQTYSPTTVRAMVVGHGHAKESDIKVALRQHLGLERAKKGEGWQTHDYDALAVALCCAVQEEFLKSIQPQGESAISAPAPARKSPQN